jgi:hypothetical protein
VVAARVRPPPVSHSKLDYEQVLIFMWIIARQRAKIAREKIDSFRESIKIATRNEKGWLGRYR